MATRRDAPRTAQWQIGISLAIVIAGALNIVDRAFASGSFGAPLSSPAIGTTNASTDTGHDATPDLATDGHGVWVAVSQSTENLGGTIGSDTDIFFARSLNNGQTWSAPAVLNTT